MAGVLLVGVCHAESTSPSQAGSRCVDTSRSVSSCKEGATIRDPDTSSIADPDEPASADRADRADLDGRAQQLDTMNQQLRMERRRKDSLLRLYPDEAAHNAARVHELAEKDKPIRAAEERIDDLTRERMRIGEATGFYAGMAVPADLRNQAQRVDIALQEARSTLRNCRDERPAGHQDLRRRARRLAQALGRPAQELTTRCAGRPARPPAGVAAGRIRSGGSRVSGAMCNRSCIVVAAALAVSVSISVSAVAAQHRSLDSPPLAPRPAASPVAKESGAVPPRAAASAASASPSASSSAATGRS